MGYDTLVSVKKATNGKKDYTAIFRDSKTGKEKKTHFGDATMDHYNIHKDKNRREKYRSRHKKDLNTGDPTRAGYLSYYLLWGESTSLRTNLATYRKRFFPKSAKSPTKKTSPKRKSMKGPGKPPANTGLQRWHSEKWTDEKGNECGSSKNKNTKKCRPSKKITEGTPVTWKEMSPSQKRKAVSEKKQVGMGTKASPIRKKKKTSPKKKVKISSKRKTMNTPLCPRGLAYARSRKDHPSAYSNSAGVKVCKGSQKGIDGKRKCQGVYC